MTARACIIGAGIVGALGEGPEATEATLRKGASGVGRFADLFPLQEGARLPVGQAAFAEDAASPLPRCHQLALCAARQALAGRPAPDAVIVGCTTGGMLATENFLLDHEPTAGANPYHGLHTVAAEVARLAQCSGPALTVSTACSSGALALALALRLLRSGRARRVLAGGADSLCRLTCFGFHSLQLVDADGPKPLDAHRRGMAVAEGAAFLYLSAEEEGVLPRSDTLQPPLSKGGAERSEAEGFPLAELAGAGLSCDAWHPTAPHPEGEGALAAMRAALADAGLHPADIDYINLHGTGTPDNDLAEARALRRLFAGAPLPPLSSVKGASGHPLAAAGAGEAVVGALALAHGFIPANTGCVEPDPALNLTPQLRPENRSIRTVLSNSFGFGGNNAALVLARPGTCPARPKEKAPPLFVHAAACLTGAGDLSATMARLDNACHPEERSDEGSPAASLIISPLSPSKTGRGAGGEGRRLPREAALSTCAGLVDADAACAHVPPRRIRRLKRLSRLGLALAAAVVPEAERGEVSSVFWGSGWGAMSESADFLAALRASGQRFGSPTDFVGSVHNSPSGQIALWLGAGQGDAGGGHGANVAAAGGNAAFAEAAFAATLLACRDGHAALLAGADEHHPDWTPMLDEGAVGRLPADGGGALLLKTEAAGALARLGLCELAASPEALSPVARTLRGRVGLLLVDECADAELAELRRLFDAPLWPYREHLGHFASAQAVAAALAASWLGRGFAPAFYGGNPLPLAGKSALLLALRPQIALIELAPA